MSWSVKICESDVWLHVIDVTDTGISASVPGGGNVYTVQDPGSGKILLVHQDRVKELDLQK